MYFIHSNGVYFTINIAFGMQSNNYEVNRLLFVGTNYH